MALTAVLSAGCGPTPYLLAALGLTGGSKSRHSPPVPVVAIDSALDRAALTGDQVVRVPIRYTLTTQVPISASLVVELALASAPAAFSPAHEGPGSDGTSGLAADPAGTPHVFVWDAQGDLGGGKAVILRFTAVNGSIVGPSVEAQFVAGNDAPAVLLDPAREAIAPGSSGPAVGIVAVRFLIADTTSDLSSIAVELATSGGGFRPASAALGATTNLDTGPAGLPHDFAWDSVRDLGRVRQEGVLVRITATDRFGAAGAPLVVGPVTVDNNHPPLVQVVEPGLVLDRSGEVGVKFRLFDDESDPSAAIVQFARGDDPFPALPAAIVDPAARRAILADPARRQALGIVTEAPVLREARVATASAVRVASHDLRDPLASTRIAGRRVLFLDGALAGTARTAAAYDAHGAAISLDAPLPTVPLPGDRFLVDLRPGMDGLATGPAGVAHAISWDSVADLGRADATVRLKVTPLDSELGTPVETLPFALANAPLRLGPSLGPIGELAGLSAPIGATQSKPPVLAVVDVNGDGRADLIVSDRATATTHIFFQSPSGTLAEAGASLTSGGGMIRGAAAPGGPAFVAVQELGPPSDNFAISTPDGSTIAVFAGRGALTRIGAVRENGLTAFDLALVRGSPLLAIVAVPRPENALPGAIGALATGSLASFGGETIVLALVTPGGVTTTCLAPRALEPPPVAVALGDLHGAGGIDVVVLHDIVLDPSRSSGTRHVTIFRDLLTREPGSPFEQYAEEGLDLAIALDPSFSAAGFAGVPPIMAVGDITGDGRSELAIAHDGQLDVFTPGPSGLAPLALTPVGSGFSDAVTAVAIGDVDGDGRADLVLGTESGLQVFLQTSAGSLGAPTAIPGPQSTNLAVALSLAVGDLNGDGVADVAFSGNVGTGVFFGVGPLAWQPSVVPLTEFLFAEFPAGFYQAGATLLPDGRGEVAYHEVFANFTASPPVFASQIRTLAPGDSDAIVAATPEPFGSLGPAFSFPEFVHSAFYVTGDLDGDGVPDAVGILGRGASAPEIVILRGRSNGTFDTSAPLAVSVPAGLSVFAVRIGDFDGDGLPDLAIDVVLPPPPPPPPLGPPGPPPPPPPPRTHELLIYPGQPGGFPAASPIAVTLSAGASAQFVADIDGDGRLDLLSSDHTGAITILFGTGSPGAPAFGRKATFTPIPPPWLPPFFHPPFPAALADFDGDGFPDILMVTPAQNPVLSLVRGGPGGRFGAPVPIGTVNVPPAAGEMPTNLNFVPFDLDGDGRLDVVAIAPSPLDVNNIFGVVAFFQDPDGAFRRSASLTAPGPVPVVATVFPIDVTSDGRKDLVIAPLGQAGFARGLSGEVRIEGLSPGLAPGVRVDAFVLGPGGPRRVGRGLTAATAAPPLVSFSIPTFGVAAGDAVEILAGAEAAIVGVTPEDRAGGAIGGVALSPLSTIAAEVALARAGSGAPDAAAAANANAATGFVLSGSTLDAARGGIARAGEIAALGNDPAALRARLIDAIGRGALALPTAVAAVAAGGLDPSLGAPVLAQMATMPTPLLPPPALASIAPVAGPIGGGAAVTVAGSGFAPGAALLIGGPRAAISALSPTAISAMAPQGSPGPADVTVVNPDNQSATLAAAFKYFRGAGAIAVSPAAIDFGAVAVATTVSAAVVIENAAIASGPLHVSALLVDPPFAVLSPAPPLTIAPGAAARVAVAFAPGGTGSAAGTLTILSDDPDVPVATVDLAGASAFPVSGLGFGPPVVAPTVLGARGWFLDVGGVTLGATVAFPLVLESIAVAGGGAPMTVLAAAPQRPGPPGPFSIAGLPVDLAPGEKKTVSLLYSPSQSLAPDFASIDFQVSGLASTLAVTGHTNGMPILTLEPGPGGYDGIATDSAPNAFAPSFDFGPVAVATPALPLTIQLRNRADATVPLTITAIALSGATDFSLARPSGAPLPLTLAPGAAEALVLGFTPGAVGPTRAAIAVSSSDPRFPSGLTIPLAGAGVDAAATPLRFGAGGAAGLPITSTGTIAVTVFDQRTGLGLPAVAVAIFDSSSPVTPLAVTATDAFGTAAVPITASAAVDVHAGDPSFGLRSFLGVTASRLEIGVGPVVPPTPGPIVLPPPHVEEGQTPLVGNFVIAGSGGAPGDLLPTSGYDGDALAPLPLANATTAQTFQFGPNGGFSAIPRPDVQSIPLSPVDRLSRFGASAFRFDPFAMLCPDGSAAISDAAFSGPLPLATAPQLVVPLVFGGPPLTVVRGTVAPPAGIDLGELLPPLIARATVAYPPPADPFLGQTVGLGAGGPDVEIASAPAPGAISFTLTVAKDPFAATGISAAAAADLRIEVTVGDRSQTGALANRVLGNLIFLGIRDFTGTTTGYVHFDPAGFAGFPAEVAPPALLAIPRVIAPVDPAAATPLRLPFGFAFTDVIGAAGTQGYYRVLVEAHGFSPSWAIVAPAPATAMAIPALPRLLAALVPGGDVRWTIEANAVPGFRYGSFRFSDVARGRTARALAAADFTIVPPLAIKSISPPDESAASLSPVTILGVGFTRSASVTFTIPGAPGPIGVIPLFPGPGQIVVQPPSPPGGTPLPLTATVTVTNPDGDISSAPFTYDSPPPAGGPSP